MTLVTQFGGGKTHTLTALYHLAKSGSKVKGDSGVAQMLSDAGLSEVPAAKVAVFVGNAWDSGEGRETPWIDIARQLAGEAGVKALGTSAKEIPPGTNSIAKLIEAAGGSVLILCDEVLNYINRYQGDGAIESAIFYSRHRFPAQFGMVGKESLSPTAGDTQTANPPPQPQTFLCSHSSSMALCQGREVKYTSHVLLCQIFSRNSGD